MNKNPPAARSRAGAAPLTEVTDEPVTPPLAIVTTPPEVTQGPTLTEVSTLTDVPTPIQAPTLTEIPTPIQGPTVTQGPTYTQGIKLMIKTPQDFAQFGKENLEAFTAAGKIWAAGVQDLTQQVAATAKASLEASVATFKALTAVKSVKEAIDLQSTYGKAAISKALAETTKLQDASLKLTEQTMAPLTARMAVAVGAFSKAA